MTVFKLLRIPTFNLENIISLFNANYFIEGHQHLFKSETSSRFDAKKALRSIGRKSLTAIALGGVTSCAVAWSLAVPRTTNAYLMALNFPATEPTYARCVSSTEGEGQTLWAYQARGNDCISIQGEFPHDVLDADRTDRFLANYSLLHTDRDVSPYEHGRPTVEGVWSLPHDGKKYTSVATHTAGWPARCLRSFSLKDTNNTLIEEGALHLPPRLQFDGPSQIAGMAEMNSLPLIPYWPGLLANTALYGAAWAGVIQGQKAVRTTLRRVRGVCPNCAYDRKGLPTATRCPECGHI